MAEIVATFGERLKEIMSIRNVRAVDITRHCNISPSQISHYLKDDYAPKQPVIVKLARYLRVNEVWLIGYDCDMERYTQTYDGTVKEIVEMLETLDNNDLERVRTFIKDYFIDR
jgi:transcriptional regulator with XRE-family HTH domain